MTAAGVLFANQEVVGWWREGLMYGKLEWVEVVCRSAEVRRSLATVDCSSMLAEFSFFDVWLATRCCCSYYSFFLVLPLIIVFIRCFSLIRLAVVRAGSLITSLSRGINPATEFTGIVTLRSYYCHYSFTMAQIVLATPSARSLSPALYKDAHFRSQTDLQTLQIARS